MRLTRTTLFSVRLTSVYARPDIVIYYLAYLAVGNRPADRSFYIVDKQDCHQIVDAVAFPLSYILDDSNRLLLHEGYVCYS